MLYHSLIDQLNLIGLKFLIKFNVEIAQPQDKNKTSCSPVDEPANLAMFVNNHFFTFFDSSWNLEEILTGWPLATRLAFSKSKMAAKMAAQLGQNQDFIITFVLSTVE